MKKTYLAPYTSSIYRLNTENWVVPHSFPTNIFVKYLTEERDQNCDCDAKKSFYQWIINRNYGWQLLDKPDFEKEIGHMQH